MTYEQQYNACMSIFTAFPIRVGAKLTFTFRDDGTALALLDDKKYTGKILIPDVVTCEDITSKYFGQNFNVVGIPGRGLANGDFTSLDTGNGVQSIAAYAFSNAYDMKEITLGENVTYFNNAFFFNSKLSKVIYNCIYASAGNTAGAFSQGNVTEVIIGPKVQILPRGVFGRTKITEVVIPSNVGTIGMWAFYECTKLVDVVIEEGVGYIGQEAFRGCTALTTITIPSSVSIIDTNAFKGCTSLTEIIINGSPGSINVSNPDIDWNPDGIPVTYTADGGFIT